MKSLFLLFLMLTGLPSVSSRDALSSSGVNGDTTADESTQNIAMAVIFVFFLIPIYCCLNNCLGQRRLDDSQIVVSFRDIPSPEAPDNAEYNFAPLSDEEGATANLPSPYFN